MLNLEKRCDFVSAESYGNKCDHKGSSVKWIRKCEGFQAQAREYIK